MTRQPPPPPLTPAMRELLARMARSRRPALHKVAPQEARALYNTGAEVLDL
ncbi:MAG: hypothetical protein RIQ60_4408, partial [Pseudomonadota bacterium]